MARFQTKRSTRHNAQIRRSDGSYDVELAGMTRITLDAQISTFNK